MPDPEGDIATYLTVCGKVFIAPQYNIAFDKNLNEGGSCPDFVAIDLGKSEIIVVEVTVAASVKELIKRVVARQTRWYQPIQRTFSELNPHMKGWKIRFLGFVRGVEVDNCNKDFQDQEDVWFAPIECATFPWYYWDYRLRTGLPSKSTPTHDGTEQSKSLSV